MIDADNNDEFSVCVMRNEIMKMGAVHTPGIRFPPPWQHDCRSYEQWRDWQAEWLIIFKLLFSQLSIFFLLSL